jgi:hypothetical protein
MKSTATIFAALITAVISATAGTAPAPAPSGKGPVPPPPADPCAGPISYNNIELLYAYTDFDHGFDSSDGGLLRFEYSPTPYFYITGGVEYINSGYDVDVINPGVAAPRGAIGNESFSADFEQWDFTLGIGAHFPLTPHIDIAADGGVLWSTRSTDFHVPGPGNDDSESNDDTGWYVRPQFRGKWGCFTAHLGAEYRDVRDFNEWAFFGRVYYQVAPAWDITAGYRHGEDSDTVTAGVRWRY